MWWDIENCSVPSGVNVFKITQSITAAVRANGIKGPVQVTAFGDVSCLTRANQEALSSTGVNLVHIPNGGKNSADRSLLVDLMYWVSQNPPPAHIFLISGDRDFAGILHKLRMNNYNILLAGKEGKHTPGVLCSAASIMWPWNELAKGENLSGRHFNQPPDGPFNSWYGHYRGPLEDPYEIPEQQSCLASDNMSKAEGSSESTLRPVPMAVLRQLRRIVNAYPKGLNISELQSELKRMKVPIDKDYYGHRKFSRFLLSIPHIVNVVSCPDGQFFLHPVRPRVREPLEGNGTSVGSITEKKNQDVEMTRKANGQTHTITRMVDVEPQLPVSPYIDRRERTVEEKVANETPEIKAYSSTLSIEDATSNIADKTQASPGFITLVINWWKSWRNSSVRTSTEQSGEEPGSAEENSHVFDDALRPRKHELFYNDTFWSVLQSFFKTRRGSEIVINSTSREQFAERLQKEGPLILRPLQESDLHHLVDLLVSEKKLIAEFPTKTPLFKIIHPPGESSAELQPQNNQPHIFENSSSQENPQLRGTSASHKKPSEKFRREVLADCQKLLDELLSLYPKGFNMGLFKNNFLEKYGYSLDHKKLGYSKLVSLLQIMPGVKIEDAYVLRDSVVYSTGIESLGLSEKSSGSDGDVSDSPRKNEDGESPWEELGPVARQEKIFSRGQVNGNYEPSVSDDEFSELEEDATTFPVKAEDQNRSRVDEEGSSLMQILDSWYSTKDENEPQDHGSHAEGLADCSKDESEPPQSSNASDKGEAAGGSATVVNHTWKQRPQKSYMFVSDPIDPKDKLLDGILGSLKKSGESKVQE